MAIRPQVRVVFIGLLLLLWGACASEQGADLGPPQGWVRGDDGRWWREGVDTTGLFRNLESLESMSIRHEPVTYAGSQALAMRSGVGHEQLERSVKQSLIRLYRNEPVVVDSLFERFVAPRIAEADLSGDLAAARERFKREGYRLISNNFQEPRVARQLGKDIPVSYPDSLREQQVNGKVRTQVYIDAEGIPQAIELIEGVHPALDAIALRATTQMRWRPAYLMRNGNWKPIPSWVRFNIDFIPPPA